MDSEVITVDELIEFLGVDDEKKSEVEGLCKSAISDINTSVGEDCRLREDKGVFNDAVRIRTYISYYAVRDAAKNLTFLSENLTGLIISLQLSRQTGED